MNANDILKQASSIMEERGKQYDKPEGERSMAATVQAFNAIRNKGLSESDGWLFMSLLKMVRDNQSEPHTDSLLDLTAYAALYGESRLNQPKGERVILPKFEESKTIHGFIPWTGGEQPVADDVMVECLLRNGLKTTHHATWFRWSASDIIGYRVIK